MDESELSKKPIQEAFRHVHARLAYLVNRKLIPYMRAKMRLRPLRARARRASRKLVGTVPIETVGSYLTYFLPIYGDSPLSQIISSSKKS